MSESFLNSDAFERALRALKLANAYERVHARVRCDALSARTSARSTSESRSHIVRDVVRDSAAQSASASTDRIVALLSAFHASARQRQSES